MSIGQNHTMTNIICAWCGRKSSKKLSEIRFQQRKYEKAGNTGKRPCFCSRYCGQQYSGNTFYSAFTSIVSMSDSLYSRESWKYRKLENYLMQQQVDYYFEYPLLGTRFIFDLALYEIKAFVEFDGGYHVHDNQVRRDSRKDKEAAKRGWSVYRIPVKANSIIPPIVLSRVLSKFDLIGHHRKMTGSLR